ncbi:MAG: SRPBCC family protein [Planctomycetales bacterium]
MAQFETSVAIPCSLESAYDFLLRPANVKLITPPEVGLHFEAAPEVIGLGDKLEFKIQGFGQVQTFLHQITALDPHHLISEKQLKGLFGRWEHDHLFALNGNSEVVITDRIEFDPPSGLLGFLVTKKKILEYLEEGFEHRQERLRKLLAAG